MSSFLTSEVTVQSGVQRTSQAMARGAVSAGMMAVGAGAGAAIAGAAIAAGAVFGAGWILYNSGKLVYNEMERMRRETEEKKERERIAENHKCEMAQADREKIIQKCDTIRQIWEDSVKAAGISVKENPQVEQLFTELQEIEKRMLHGKAGDMEQTNLRDLEYLNLSAKQMEELLQNLSENMQKETDRQILVGILEKLHKMMQTISLDMNASGHDVQGRSVEAEYLRRLKERTEAVLVDLKYAIHREAMRELHMPVSEEDKQYLHQLFDGTDQIMHMLIYENIGREQKEYLLEHLEKRLSQYQTKQSQLNPLEERFVCMYQAYLDVCSGIGEIPKGPTDFASIEDLEIMMEYMKKRVERMETCAEIYTKLGKEAYICMAFDVEMERLGYKVAERKRAQEYVSGKLANGEIPYYSMPDQSLTQFYYFGDATCVQVIVREDGSTSLETFARSAKENQQEVIEEQKKHCKLNAQLQKALKENWFVCCDLSEVIPPEYVNVKNPKAISNPTYVEGAQTWEDVSSQTHVNYQTVD